ncbi:hypothetical protein D8B26_007239 [Coccidioides posadasii str. Silveira]|uniref:Uncharacterized protein n=3 Tax=Coccidioides posadasii TaxID=199306 RepID=E9D360_COCPS|nr:hypothetical protein CPC735_012840 [Coccidioides posadasii C735 delta SOWgp]EER29966.1 hypothetical protein CPC735_012840 [Coccidioides posadasii C735 delta SOWgp]EFW19055.1 conserved hypothetical protein [Coccidioides posadasii str. Silveira]KMM71399.1 hypothetical protein CPAG_07706 [Coccidioides posadasii RMSCC 3488]QVM12620.1 hypothetical protein D8B26_007239 [Coccidioides posadasii str. Silveira]|eukprot:XP_003072111.1 hypothetical protein CPC735_012840 [Coccidioides posadasii C735 delta SOWgp]
MWPGLPSVIIRFVCHVPTGMVGIIGLNLYNLVHDLDIYDVLPNGKSFLQGLHLVGTVGTATFAWNFVMFAASNFTKGFLLATIGFIDLGLSAALILGISWQSQFLPRSYASCKDAVDWRNGTDGRNLFVEVSKANLETVIPPHKSCRSFVQNWAVGIAVIILYLVCGLLNVILGFAYVEARDSFLHPAADYSDCCSCYIPTRWISRPISILFCNTKLGSRFALRYLSKCLQAVRRTSNEKFQTSRAKDEDLTEKSALALISAKVTDNWHYVDIVELSPTPIEQFGTNFELEKLRKYTCEGISKDKCRVCKIQICNSCSTLGPVWESQPYRHMTICKPCCTKCFYTSYYRIDRERRHKRTDHRATCKVAHGNIKFAQRPNDAIQGRLCRLCEVKTPEQRQEILDTQDRLELQREARDHLACSRCNERLSSNGPRWWVCAYCDVECHDHIHPPWALGV